MMVTSKVQDAVELDDSAAAAREQAVALAPRIERCGAKAVGQLLLKCDEPAVIAVDVTGQPAPEVRWHVAGRRVRKSERYCAAVSGRRYTLTVLRVTDELEKGVWVMASNSAGEDSCLFTIKTYKVLSGLPNSFHDSVQNARQSIVLLNRMSTQRSADRPFSPIARDPDATSPTLTEWNREMEIRNRMRSVDDLMYYGTWKRETLKAQRRNDDKTDRRCVDGGSASLNQSYSGASTLTATAATDDEGRHGPTQRRRRTLRLRRRPAGGLNSSISSIVSAPTATRQFNLDESAGSGALDVDSMFRFFASSTQTPVADDAVCSRTVKTRGLPPPGLPPSGRTTSVRRTSVRRRRRPNSSMTDVTNGFTDTASSSFDGVKMTSSSADLKDATATTVMSAVTQPESCSVERSRPVRRSLRRRRRTSESPSGTGAQDLTDVEAQAHVTPNSAASSDVIEPEALWELCGEKLNELCRRILGTGVAVTDYVVTGVAPPENITEPAHTEVKVVQPSVVDKSPPYNEVASESRRTTGVFHSVDLSAYRVSLIPDVIPDLDQPSQSLDRTAGAVEKKVTDVDGSVISHVDDDDYSREPTSLAVAEGDVHRRDGVETADGHVPPQDGERYVKQFQTATYSPEQWRVQLELEEAMVSDQLRTDQTPPMIGENHADVVDDDQLSDDGASNIVEERRGSPREDISAMLAPSIDLQDILDTIYTLTGGVSGENSMTDEDATPSLSTHGLPPNSLVSGIKTCVNQEGVDASQKLPDDVHLAEQSAAVCLDRADDDDESSLDLDVEMYDYDLSPAAGDLADSVHLAIAEDDDDIDLDIADYEYDLDDDVL